MSGWNRNSPSPSAKSKRLAQAKVKARSRAENPKPCERCYAPLETEAERKAGIHARHK